MVALRGISAGEDLLLCYGKLDNTLLLLDYGAAPLSALGLRLRIASPCPSTHAVHAHLPPVCLPA